MQTYPLVRVKWSNEHIMAILFGVLILYMLPGWLRNPGEIPEFIAVFTVAVLVDTVFNFIRKKQLLCAVSSAITAAILQILTPGAPLWGRILGVVAALLIGKHIWGGTGKNPINPALTGVLLIYLLFPLKEQVFMSTALLLPAILLSIPFIIFRPFAAIGFIAGAAVYMLAYGDLNLLGLISTGVFFWGCIIFTDPVTITSNPLIGGVGGLLTGIIALQFSEVVFPIIIGILLINIISAIIEKLEKKTYYRKLFFLRPKKIKTYLKQDLKVYDLTDEGVHNTNKIDDSSKQEILEKIKENEVYGFGGAGFSTSRKITVVIEAKVRNKHLIINAIECDPGLLHDKWLLRNKSNEILSGIEAVGKCIIFKSVTLAVKDMEGLPYTMQDCKTHGFTVKQVPDYFPVGAEKFLIKEVLNRRIDEEVIPAQEGILVLNLQTIYAIYEAVYINKKAETKFITVGDIKQKAGYVVKVRLGEKIQNIIDTIVPHRKFIFCGGGMMQCRNVSEEEIVDKSVNFVAISDFPRYKESQLCSQCGFCKLVCPTGLVVNKIAGLIDEGFKEKTRKYHPENCIQCGRCSSVCLAGKNLSDRMKIAKEYIIS